MSNSNQAFLDYLNYNSPISPINIHQSLSSFFPQYRYSVQLQPQSSFIPISTNYPPQSPTFYRRYNTPTYYPMERYSTLPSTQGPVEYVDEVAIISATTNPTSDYEDILEPQRQMGGVDSGLSEKSISKNLKTSLYQVYCRVEEQEGEEVCAVCQDEYKLNDTIGTLECRHRYHANCIKKWLLRKNDCPVCRATLSVA